MSPLFQLKAPLIRYRKTNLFFFSKTAIDLQNPNLGPPIQDLVNKTTQLLNTTQEQEREEETKIYSQKGGINNIELNNNRRSLEQTLLDLFEIAKPTLIIFGILFLVSLFVLLQLIYYKHQKNRNQNRYMKHSSSLTNHCHHHHHNHQQTYSNGSSVCGIVGGGGSGSSGSSGSGSANISAGCGLTGTFVDPMLNSLMGRTLSVPGANGGGGGGGFAGAGAGKRYLSYRDHMRKVSAANNDNNNILSTISNGCDFLDIDFVTKLQHQLQMESAAAANQAPSSGGGLDRFNNNNSQRSSTLFNSTANSNSKYDDQISPYAVSSICGSVPSQQQQQQQQQLTAPLSVNSETINALNGINFN